MRTISSKKIREEVKALCIDANLYLAKNVRQALERSLKKERSSTGKTLIKNLIENSKIAAKEKTPICQDTGFTVVLVELGQEVKITGGSLNKAIHDGVKEGYTKGYLRKSIVADPFKRKNTGNNTPAVIHTEIVPGNKLKLTLMAKGGGCENVSVAKVLKPTEGTEGVEKFVLETVEAAGGNPCPPIIVGVGIGGTLDKATLLAKKALVRDIEKRNKDKSMAKFEKKLLGKINDLGIGPGGLGGRITALAVNIETFPCHIASLPVAVNIDCHAHRVKQAVI